MFIIYFIIENSFKFEYYFDHILPPLFQILSPPYPPNFKMFLKKQTKFQYNKTKKRKENTTQEEKYHHTVTKRKHKSKTTFFKNMEFYSWRRPLKERGFDKDMKGKLNQGWEHHFNTRYYRLITCIIP